jgi:hypothetical protein
MKETKIGELKDFVINDEKTDINDYDVKTMNDVLDIDFSSTEELDLDEAFEFIMMSKKPKETKELIENREANNIIKKSSREYLNDEYVDSMEKSHTNLKNMLKKYDINSDIVKGMTELEKDKIYGLAEYLFNEFQIKLNDMTFNFGITKDEWKFMYDVMYHKIEYDQNELFQLKEVRERYLEGVKEIDKTLNTDIIPSVINVNDLIILYHLISKFKVKGINKQHFSYLTLLTKIGERIKLFNAYNVLIQRLSADFQTWGSCLSVDNDEVNNISEIPNDDIPTNPGT